MISSRDITWHNPKAPLIPSLNADRSSPTALQEDIYVHVPVATAPAPTPAPTPTSPTRLSPPILSSNPVASIPPRVTREQHRDGYEEMPGQACDETRAMNDASREYDNRHGLLSTMDHAALVSMLATRESFDEGICNHGPPNKSPGIYTCVGIHTPASVSEAEASPHGQI